MPKCFVIQRQVSKTLYTVARHGDGRRSILAFKTAGDARMFASWIRTEDGPCGGVTDGGLRRPQQAIVVESWPYELLVAACSLNALAVTLMDGHEPITEEMDVTPSEIAEYLEYAQG